jgi:hypothetical protein
VGIRLAALLLLFGVEWYFAGPIVNFICVSEFGLDERNLLFVDFVLIICYRQNITRCIRLGGDCSVAQNAGTFRSSRSQGLRPSQTPSMLCPASKSHNLHCEEVLGRENLLRSFDVFIDNSDLRETNDGAILL